MESKKTSGINCSQYLSRCKAQCCGPAPMPKRTLNDHKDKIVRKITEVIKVPGSKQVVALTADGSCCFLREDHRCNIYEHRPHICQIFGKGEHEKLKCSWLLHGTAEFPKKEETK